MFHTVKRIIDWCGDFKGKLYLGFVMTFFSHIFTALPLALAAYTVGALLECQQAGAAFDTAWIWKTIVIQIALVLLRFLFDYFRARLQEPISYQLTARDRLAIGDALKRVSLGYFQSISTGNILNSITTGLSTLENMGIRMIDNFVGGLPELSGDLPVPGGVQSHYRTDCADCGSAVPVLYAGDLSLHLHLCPRGGASQPGHDRRNSGVCQRAGGSEILWKKRHFHGRCHRCRPGQ